MTAERRRQKRLDRTVRVRRRVLLAAWGLAVAVLVARAVQIQVVQGATWHERAEAQHRGSETVVAPRGAVLDRDGIELAVSTEVYRVGVSPREVTQPEEVAATLSDVLGVDEAEVLETVRSEAAWRRLPGRYMAHVRPALRGLRGVYIERQLRRDRLHDRVAAGVLGLVMEGRGRGGIEQQFDSVLRGTPGRTVYARDNHGNRIPGEALTVQEPRRGGSVVLTLDIDLQEIAQEALLRAIEETEAEGGDLLITDPRTGDVLALASVHQGNLGALSAINTPYEPGSTLKPITMAGLMRSRLASFEDEVDVEEGHWTVHGRRITDVGRERGVISLRTALQASSNVGLAKAAQAYEPADHYQMLRDFGFGVATGLELPGEVGGTLRHPDDWSLQSPASLAIGYEIGVTPLQMAMAYGALANGGRLMQPRLVREVRDENGDLIERHEPRVVREVLPRSVSRRISDALVEVVEDGTGAGARLASFAVAGKSGTTRAWSDGAYQAGEYFASFVGYFPASDPQMVVLVKLDRPHGDRYYGGALAAPVTKATMEAVLASQHLLVDRHVLVSVARPSAEVEPAADVVPGPVAAEDARFVSLDLPADPAPAGVAADLGSVDALRRSQPTLVLPDVSGLPVRAAVRRLHGLGFRVVWDGTGSLVTTLPEAGVAVTRGDTIRLRPTRRADG